MEAAQSRLVAGNVHDASRVDQGIRLGDAHEIACRQPRSDACGQTVEGEPLEPAEEFDEFGDQFGF